MVATVNIFTDFGGSDGNPSNEQNISSNSPVHLRFKTADNNTVDSVDEIKIPETGTNRSYWKHVYLKITGGTFSRINNIKFYTGGTNFGTGITMNVGNETPTKNSNSNSGYVVASGTRGESGGQLDSVNETSDYLVFQMDVGSTATKADLSNKTWTFQYDEV